MPTRRAASALERPSTSTRRTLRRFYCPAGPSVRPARQTAQGHFWPHVPALAGLAPRRIRRCASHAPAPARQLERLELFQRFRCGVDVVEAIAARQDELPHPDVAQAPFGNRDPGRASCWCFRSSDFKIQRGASLLDCSDSLGSAAEPAAAEAVRPSTKLNSPSSRSLVFRSATARRSDDFRKLLLSNFQNPRHVRRRTQKWSSCSNNRPW